VVPYFEQRQLRAITVTAVRRWQHELLATRQRPTVMAARSILYRILQAAEDERVIFANPSARCRPPNRRSTPTRELPSTVRRILHILQADGPLALDQLAERFSAPGGKLRRRTVQAALDTLEADGLALPVIYRDGPLCWSAAELDQPRRFADLDLRGPHDLRHTFATWLEDAAIPSRVIDEVMGHAGGRHPEQGSRMGRVYRETMPEMVTRVVAAIQVRLAMVLEVAGRSMP
jgi:hypothetical protein